MRKVKDQRRGMRNVKDQKREMRKDQRRGMRKVRKKREDSKKPNGDKKESTEEGMMKKGDNNKDCHY